MRKQVTKCYQMLGNIAFICHPWPAQCLSEDKALGFPLLTLLPAEVHQEVNYIFFSKAT